MEFTWASPSTQIQKTTMRMTPVLIAVLAAGCAHSGPFVTQVGALPDGRLAVRKCTADSDILFGLVRNGECHVETVPAIQDPNDLAMARGNDGKICGLQEFTAFYDNNGCPVRHMKDR